MLGRHEIRIGSKNYSFHLMVERKFTVLMGESGIGKSVFVDMVENQEYYDFYCDVPVIGMQKRFGKWGDSNEYLNGMSGCIMVVDEDFDGLHSDGFARMMMTSDNYFVLVSRDPFSNIPYSYTSIYRLRERRYGDAWQMYNERFYGGVDCSFDPDLLITEDSRCGFQMLSSEKYESVSAGSNSGILSKLLETYIPGRKTCIVVDGAAFGAFIGSLVTLVEHFDGVVLFLPESFEHLMLLSGAVEVDKQWVRETYDYCEVAFFTRQFGISVQESDVISWERFYYRLLCCLANAAGLHYSKGKMSLYFMKFRNTIIKLLEELG